MTSEKAIAANRRNARRSTGPRTAAGKRNSAANALTHGATASVAADPALRAVVGRIASVLAGPGASSARLARVMSVAEAEARLLRLRNARVASIERAAAKLPDHADCAPQAVVQSLTSLTRLGGYEGRIMARRKRALCDLRNFPMGD